MNTDTAIFKGDCFWCTEAIYINLKEVVSVTPGYSGGTTRNPTYDQVCSGSTLHAKVIRVEFDTSLISYETLLDVFFHVHDPTTLNMQGIDVGTQYRSIILYTNTSQKHIAEQIVERLNKNEFSGHIKTKIEQLDKFYLTEDYHKNYFKKNSYQPYCQIVISPKRAKMRKKYAKLYKNQ